MDQISSDWIIAIAAIFQALFACAVVIFALKTNQYQKRLNWLTGATTSHSALQTQLKAYELKIPVVWWDPNHEQNRFRPGWPSEGRHGEQLHLNLIRQGLPLDYRERVPRWHDCLLSMHPMIYYLGAMGIIALPVKGMAALGW